MAVSHTASAPPDLLPVPWLLARGSTTLEQREQVARELTALVERGVPARTVLTRLADHGLVPLAYRHLVASGDVPLAESLAAEISAEFRRHVLTRFKYTRRLRQLLDVLADAGVEAVPYKGPALATQLFGNFAMRQFGDLDILVRPSDARLATDALVAAGLTRVRAIDERWEPYLHQVRHSLELRDRPARVVIELHWSVADRFLGMDLDVDWLLSGTTTIDLIGRATAVMQGERLLLALCLHGAKHLWERAVWLAEIGELVARSGAIDWTAAFSRADQTGCGRIVRSALHLVRELVGVAPPAPYDRELNADRGALRLASLLADRMRSSARDRLQARFRLGFRAQTSLWRRAMFCWRVATDLSERDLRRLEAPPRAPLTHALRRGRRLFRTLRAERRRA